MTTAANTLPRSATRKVCWRCGESFACGAGDAGEACWCDSRPPAPITNPEADCLCPNCLTAVAIDVREIQPIPSPCVKTCRIAPQSGFCIGCRRTVDEIAAWSAFSDEERQAVIDALPGRKL